MRVVHKFPLFPLGAVALPTELIPLQVSEERFKRMIDRCLEDHSEFGIVWLSDDGIRPIGCACEIAEILEKFPDGRMHVLARGTRPFRITEREEKLPYPAGTVEFLDDRDEMFDEEASVEAHAAYSHLVEQITDTMPEAIDLMSSTAYEMAATLELGLDAKQDLLDLRSESARLRLLSRLFRAASRRLDSLETTQRLARTNGKVHFPLSGLTDE
jgi:Lon protease-like protein